VVYRLEGDLKYRQLLCCHYGGKRVADSSLLTIGRYHTEGGKVTAVSPVLCTLPPYRTALLYRRRKKYRQLVWASVIVKCFQTKRI